MKSVRCLGTEARPVDKNNPNSDNWLIEFTFECEKGHIFNVQCLTEDETDKVASFKENDSDYFPMCDVCHKINKN